MEILGTKRLIAGTALSAIIMWLLAGLWHLVIVPGFYERGAGATHHEGGGLTIVAYLMLAAIMAAMYRRANLSGGAIVTGLTIGLLVGLLWVTPHAMVRAVVHSHDEPVRYGYLAINGLWHLVEQGVGGVVMGAAFGWRRA